jgi:hypothetical protein
VAAGEAGAEPVVAAGPVVVAEPEVAAEPVVVAGPAVAAGAVLGAVAEDLVVEVALPGVPAERLELGQQGLPAEWAAAVGQQPEAALPPGRAARGPRA